MSSLDRLEDEAARICNALDRAIEREVVVGASIEGVLIALGALTLKAERVFCEAGGTEKELAQLRECWRFVRPERADRRGWH